MEKKAKKALKSMKRMPLNWGENLMDSDIDEIFQHWVDRLDSYKTAHYSGLVMIPHGTDADIRIVESRIALWSACQQARQQGQKIMPLIRAYQHRRISSMID